MGFLSSKFFKWMQFLYISVDCVPRFRSFGYVSRALSNSSSWIWKLKYLCWGKYGLVENGISDLLNDDCFET